MARAKKPLLVPVRLVAGGILHDTKYARGAVNLAPTVSGG